MFSWRHVGVLGSSHAERPPASDPTACAPSHTASVFVGHFKRTTGSHAEPSENTKDGDAALASEMSARHAIGSMLWIVFYVTGSRALIRSGAKRTFSASDCFAEENNK